MNPVTNDFSILLEHLLHGDLAKRQQAMIALATVKDDRLIEPCLHCLTDEDATVRANAVACLGVNRAEQAVSALVPLLHDPNEIVRERTATSLAQIGTPDVIDPLITALDDKNTWVRNRVIYVLGASRDGRAIDPLIELLDHKDATTQGVAAWALGNLGANTARQPLLGLLRDKVASVRGNAAWALGEIGDASTISPLINLLSDKDPEVRGKTAWALGNLGQSLEIYAMVKPLMRLLDDFTEVKDSSAHTFVCQYAAEALVQLNTPEAQKAVEAWRPRAQQALAPYRTQELIKSLGHPDSAVREEAVSVLSGMGGEAVSDLVKALQHKQVRVRQNSARVLGNIGALPSVLPLLNALSDVDSGVWSQSVGALAKMPFATHALQNTFHNASQPLVKMGVAIALWRIQREESAFPWLLMAIQHDDLLVRSSAVTSLWTQPDERAVATLQIALTMEDTMLNRYIVQALQAIGTSTAIGTIQHWMNHTQPNNR